MLLTCTDSLLFCIFTHMGDINYPHTFIQVQCCPLSILFEYHFIQREMKTTIQQLAMLTCIISVIITIHNLLTTCSARIYKAMLISEIICIKNDHDCFIQNNNTCMMPYVCIQAWNQLKWFKNVVAFYVS